MKKLFLILILASSFATHAANPLKIANYRWRNDNGTETSATWKAATNSPITLTARNQNVRLRLNQYVTLNNGTVTPSIFYSKNGGTRVKITNYPSNDFVLSPSSFVTHFSTTTNQLPTNYLYHNGVFLSESSYPSNVVVPKGKTTEIEYCIRATAAAVNNTNYTFSLDIAYDTNLPPASLTTQFCEPPSTPTTNFSSGGINYVVTTPTTVAVVNNSGATGNVVIPAEVPVDCQTLAVTSIDTNAFSGCSGLTSITIPSTITSIGTNAFSGCTGLTSVVCNVSNPILIDATVFAGVNQANCSLNVPNASITGYQAAAVWQNFSPIVCNPTINAINVESNCSYTWAHNGQTYTTSGVYTGSTTNCVIDKLNLTINPAPTIFNSGGIFYVVTSPTTVSVGSNPAIAGAVAIPATVTTSCGTYAVTGVNSTAFFSNTVITSITIPNSVTSIGVNAFDSCSELTSVTLPNALTTINEGVFNNCTKLTTLTIPNSVESIGTAAFMASGLTSVTFPNALNSIGEQAFRSCTSLTSIICNVSSPITINANVFGNVNQPACRLAVPAASVAAYQAAAVWQNFNPINSIVFNTTTVTACASYTWANNNVTYTTTGVYTGTTTSGITEQLDLTITTPPTNFTSDGINYVVTSPTTVAVGVNASATGVVVIPDSVTTACGTYAVTSIGGYAFLECSALTSVTIPNSVTSIGEFAFAVTGLTSVTIPNSVTSIGGYAFAACSNLATVTCNASVPLVIDASVFLAVNQAACILVVPVGAVASYQAAAVWKDFGAVVSNPTFTNTTTISACGSYTWLVNNQTYTTSGTYYYASTNDSTNYTVETLALTLQTNLSSAGINYVITSPTTVAVGVNSGATGVVVIPATINTTCGTFAVTNIGESAFASCSNLTSVDIPNSVTSIGSNAFRRSGLTSVTIPNSVISIDIKAFSQCLGLTSVTLGNSITSIGTSAFQGCSSLTSIICNINSPVTVDGVTFSEVPQAICSLTVPNASVAAYQAADVWKDFNPITSADTAVYNTTTVTACASYTWANNNVTYTTTGVYTGTTTSGITEKLDLTITAPPTNITSDGINYVVTSPSTVAVDNNQNATGAIVIPPSVITSCGTYSVTRINNDAFRASTITSVSIPNSVTSIGSYAFSICRDLTSVAIPNSVTSIGPTAFYNCSGLTSVVISNSVTTIDNNTFFGCTGLTSVTIPNSVTSINVSAFQFCSGLTSVTIGNSVTSISPVAFQGCTGLTSVTIPNSVTTIDFFAFTGCSGLTTVTIGNSVTSINGGAFSGCTGLTSVICNLSTPVAIAANVFGNVNQAACSLTVPNASVAAYQAAAVWQNFAPILCANPSENTTTITACDSYTWNGTAYNTTGIYTGVTANCVTEKLDLTIIITTSPSASAQNFCDSKTVADLVATGTDLKWYTVATNGTALASNSAIATRTYYVTQTLNSCESARTSVAVTVNTSFISNGINYVVTSPTTVAVGVNASATGVIVIPDSVTTACGTYAVTSINEGAFFNRAGLTSVTIPNSVTSIGNIAFQNCSSLTSISIPNSVASIGFGTFFNCSVLPSVTIPNSVTSIGIYAFSGCSGLTSVTLPNAITSISDGIFNGCSQLSSISIPNTVTSIGNQVFQNCTSLTSVTIPNTVTSMGNQVFQNCSGLTSVSISNSVPSIGNQFFQFCTSLTSVTIPNSVTSIGQNAFQGCSSLSSATLSNSLTSIGSGAFNSCAVLSTVTIPNSVTSIGTFAFVSCSGLSSVTIGNSVTSIGASAFAGCTGLTSVICNVGAPITIVANVFQNVNQAACSLAVPAASVAAYQGANVWRNFAVTTTTKLLDSQCGITLAELSTVIVPVSVPVGQGYKYKVTNTVTNEVNYYTRRKIGTFALSQRADTGSSMVIKMSSTYAIAVAVKINGDFSDYGDACLISTPTLPTTKINDALCGTTLANIDSYLYLKAQVAGHKGYRYKVTQGSEETTYERIGRSFYPYPFQLKELPGGAAYATTYGIAVSVFYNGVWQPYGASCTVTTPAARESRLASTQCGMRLNKTNSTDLMASLVSVAQAYRFEVSKGASTYTVETASNLQSNFRMTEVPGLTLESGATYSIRVAIKANGIWQPYGTSCNVTTYGSPALVKIADPVAKPETIFNALAYPNPFSRAFQLELNTAIKAAVNLKVYDVLGQLIENRQWNAAESSEQEIGNNYPSGVYNIILNQGENVKTLRVIKK